MSISNRHLPKTLSIALLLAAIAVFGSQPAANGRTPKLNNQQNPDASLLQTPPGVADKSTKVFGIRIHYLEAGSGPAVILLHGLGGDTSNWAATIAPLSKAYRVIVPDQIGFGQSDKPLINYRVGTLVDFLDGFMKELKISRASLVGNSLGGWTAAAFALAHPDKVDRLILVDAAGYSLEKNVDPRSLNLLNPSTREGVKQVLSVVFYNKEMFANPALTDQFFAHKMAAGDGYTIQRFIDSIILNLDTLDNTASGIKQPTLIVWGRQDALVPLSIGERYHKDISGSQLLVIDKCGHVPQLEQSAQFNEGLLRFLAGEAVKGADASARQ
jgi:2-hydroxy-6-oxonona-2,4-dienedioate hydrolase